MPEPAAHTPFDEPRPIRQGEALDTARLARYIAAQRPELDGPLTVLQFPKGHSNLTYLIRVGEQTGRLEPMLAKLADIHEGDVQATLRRLLTEPNSVLLSSVSAARYAIHLDRIVRARFEGRLFRVPSRVMSAPTILYPGLDWKRRVELAEIPPAGNEDAWVRDLQSRGVTALLVGHKKPAPDVAAAQSDNSTQTMRATGSGSPASQPSGARSCQTDS